MEPYRRTIIDHEGTAIQPIDVNAAIGNVVNVITAGNRRGGERLAISEDLFMSLVSLVSGRVETWDPAQWRDPKKSDFEKVKTSLEALRLPIVKWVSALTSKEVLIPDVGADLAQTLKADVKKAWDVEYVHLPALGYARPSMLLRAPMNGGKPIPSIFHAAPLNGKWSEAIVKLVFHTSKHVFGPGFVPSAGTVGVGGFTANEKPWGALLAMEHQAEGTLPVPLCAYIQPALVYPRLHKALLTVMFDMAYSMFPLEKESLDPFVKAFTDVWAIPLAPVLNAVVDSFQKAKVRTTVGDHALYFRGSQLGADADIMASKDLRSRFAAQVVRAAVLDRTRAAVDPEWGTSEARDGYLTVPALYRVIRTLGRHAAAINTGAQKLGWATKAASDLGEIWQAGASFNRCDGETYSHEPAASVLGVVPTVSLGNAKCSGLDEDVERNFNAHPEVPDADANGTRYPGRRNFRYWVVVAKGHMSASPVSTGDQPVYQPVIAVVEREIIFSGQWMGEAGVSMALGYKLKGESMLAKVPEIFAAKAGGKTDYVKLMYNTAEQLTTGKKGAALFDATSWDGVTSAPSLMDAESMVAEAWKGQVEDVTSAGATFYTRETFYHRIPVQIATTGPLEFYYRDGTVYTPLPQRGTLIYNGEVTTGKTSAYLEGLISILDGQPLGRPSNDVMTSLEPKME